MRTRDQTVRAVERCVAGDDDAGLADLLAGMASEPMALRRREVQHGLTVFLRAPDAVRARVVARLADRYRTLAALPFAPTEHRRTLLIILSIAGHGVNAAVSRVAAVTGAAAADTRAAALEPTAAASAGPVTEPAIPTEEAAMAERPCAATPAAAMSTTLTATSAVATPSASAATSAPGTAVRVPDAVAADRAACLEQIGTRRTFFFADRFDALAAAELDSGGTLSAPVVATLRRAALEAYRDKEAVALARRLTEPVLNVGEPWAEAAMADAAELGSCWAQLLAHAATATSARPTGAWEKKARALLDRLITPTTGPVPRTAARRTTAASRTTAARATATTTATDPATAPQNPAATSHAAGAPAATTAAAVRTRLCGWLALVGRQRTLRLEPAPYEGEVNDLFDPYNANALRGLAWLLAMLPPHPQTARALGRLVETSLRKVPGTGPRNPKVANAGVIALSRIDGRAALAELARLAARVTYKGTLKQIDAALEARAHSLGLTRDEVEELAVPGYGLTEIGRLAHAYGELAIVGGKAVLRWHNAAGKPVKSAPAAVRREHPELVAELKATAKDIEKMLGAQSERLDRQFLARRTWSYGAWRAAYLDHPLLGTLARRLLWTVGGTPCGYADGALRTLAGDVLGTPADTAPVTLWHPVGREPAEVMAWRDWLEHHGVTQPFKQAHREVHLLSDAERATGTYSNRFAAHILRQHQFHALAAARGWRNQLRLMVDDTCPPAVRELPQWGLRAEFWIEGFGQEYGDDTTESGAFLAVTTDQIRFYPLDAPPNRAHACGGGYEPWLPDGATAVPPLPIADVPALVLSEVLRDADLFVGVAGVGNDPAWQDGGPGGRCAAYWRSYGFGELAESARSRRDVLARIVPRLAIADRAEITDRFLLIRGERHMYKIHLGSGNILMTPGDRYLCIVPRASATVRGDLGYLPFEGDRMLTLILSKALMLARDTEITDPTILSQL